MALNLKQYRLNTLSDVKAYKKAGGDEFITYYKAMKASWINYHTAVLLIY